MKMWRIYLFFSAMELRFHSITRSVFRRKVKKYKKQIWRYDDA